MQFSKEGEKCILTENKKEVIVLSKLENALKRAVSYGNEFLIVTVFQTSFHN